MPTRWSGSLPNQLRPCCSPQGSETGLRPSVQARPAKGHGSASFSLQSKAGCSMGLKALMWATGSRCNLSTRMWRRGISISKRFNSKACTPLPPLWSAWWFRNHQCQPERRVRYDKWGIPMAPISPSRWPCRASPLGHRVITMSTI